MKRIIALLFLFILTINTCFAIEENAPKDIENHWAKNEINTLIRDGIVSGYDDSFMPNKEITIAEFLKVLILKSKYKLNTSRDEWPYWYVDTAIDNNLIKLNDYEDYNSKLTRIDAVKILSNYIEYSNTKKAKNSFTDLSKENKDLILKMVSLKVINGYSDNTFKENNFVTRAEACKMILSAYNIKNKHVFDKKNEINHKNSNYNDANSGDIINQNRFKIKNKRLYIYDSGRYGKFDGLTLNKEFINEAKVIQTIKALVDDYSYTYVSYVPDKYIINSLNICYGQREDLVNNGVYAFQVKFYENARFDTSKATGIDEFVPRAQVCISINKMWDTLSEFDSQYSSSEKNLKKLEKVTRCIVNDSTKNEFIDYIKEKIIEAKEKEDDEFNPKIQETCKFGKYTVSTLCTQGTRIDFFIQFN